jgi:hypothetical protein
MFGPRMESSLKNLTRKQTMIVISIQVIAFLTFVFSLTFSLVGDGHRIIINSFRFIAIVTIPSFLCGIFIETIYSLSKYFIINQRMKKRGFIWCKTCKGGGWTPVGKPEWFRFVLRITTGSSFVKRIQGICPKCHGVGYTDWVSKVVDIGSNDESNCVQSGPGTSGP